MDQITNRISEMSPAQLFSVMNQLKQLIGQDQTGARQLLVQNPQLTLAIFQAQLTLGMTKGPGAVQKGGQGIPGDGAPPPGPPRPMGGYPGNPAAPYGALPSAARCYPGLRHGRRRDASGSSPGTAGGWRRGAVAAAADVADGGHGSAAGAAAAGDEHDPGADGDAATGSEATGGDAQTARLAADDVNPSLENQR